ncbi:hypothetical protein [Cryptosporangium phraense]|uniref:DUF4189 domain-containing protein n=1 Tax=Cryptosporangium phraense TaxID=2593070 RepID=A0A545ANE5_9ACTN|nr:hypothetical protein [Cryptosporangium phraense]TQS42781.1 hypothetical protein FL583_22215 [Cryptosporangium phraense]
MAVPLIDQDRIRPSDPTRVRRSRKPAPTRHPQFFPVLAIVATAAIILLSFLSAAENSETTSNTQVYRIDWKSPDGTWQTWTWGVATLPQAAARRQTAKRTCQRQSATHTCRATTVAEFDTAQAALAYRQTACRNHTATTGRAPAGMATCD